ncbi:hypothetical protein HMPREF2724_02960 [Corynebacterium sp. HMSC071F07]|nr:hypothetical protein HMPREF2724_02960 [Corynebacterium sp. HMSC071F07]
MAVLGYELHIEARRLSDAFAATAARVPITVASAAVARHEALDAGLFRDDGSVTGDGGGVRLINGGFVEIRVSVPVHKRTDTLIAHTTKLGNFRDVKKTLLSLILIAPLMLTACAGSDSSTTKPKDDEILGWSKAKARSYCHDQVEAKLTSPSTAKFEGPGEYEGMKTDDGNSWDLTGWVDSQNGFGATVRSTWTCTLTPSDKDNAEIVVELL